MKSTIIKPSSNVASYVYKKLFGPAVPFKPSYKCIQYYQLSIKDKQKPNNIEFFSFTINIGIYISILATQRLYIAENIISTHMRNTEVIINSIQTKFEGLSFWGNFHA